jgi:hypothetical protein
MVFFLSVLWVTTTLEFKLCWKREIQCKMEEGDKLYTLIFNTGSFLVRETLPTAEKMIHSFQFIS